MAQDETGGQGIVSGAERRVDPGRLKRALALSVEQLREGAYLVHGGAESHVVTGAACDCADAAFNRSGVCKHVLSVHLHRRLDPRVLEALRAIGRALEELEIPKAKERKAQAAGEPRGSKKAGVSSGNLPEENGRTPDVRDLVGEAVDR